MLRCGLGLSGGSWFVISSRSCSSNPDAPFENWLRLLKNNREWASETKDKDPTYFERLAPAQYPPFLYVGCADSRMPLTSFTKSGPGQFFVHRNIANQISMNDINFLATLEYAVNFLKVKHVIVGGHYNCGGIKASVTGVDSGIIANWVQPIRNLYLQNIEKLEHLPEKEKLDKLSEMNVVQQVKNLLTTKVMMENIFEKSSQIEIPTVHGIVIDLGSGHMKELPLPFDEWKSSSLLPKDFNNNGYIVGSNDRNSYMS